MKDNREFKAVVKTIKNANKDVDKVLRASKIQRHEKRNDVGWECICFMFCILAIFLIYAMVILNS